MLEGKSRTIALVFFAWTMIGADKCTWTTGNGPPPVDNVSPLPVTAICYTDPPQGCAAYCADVDDVEFTPQCSNVEAGPRTVLFQNLVDNGVSKLQAQGTQVCDGTNSGDGITSGVRTTPCQVGIQPVEWPNQSHSACNPPPPGCPW